MRLALVDTCVELDSFVRAEVYLTDNAQYSRNTTILGIGEATAIGGSQDLGT